MSVLTLKNGRVVLNGLSPTQLKMLRFIKQTQMEQGVSPSYGEIAAHMNWQTRTSVATHMKKMTERGWVAHERGVRRNIEIKIPVGL